MLLQDRVARPQGEGQVAEQVNRLFKAGTQAWREGERDIRMKGGSQHLPETRPGQSTGHSSYRVTWTAS